MKEVVVIIPIYQSKFTKSEWLSLHQGFKILSKHPICILHPKGLDIKQLEDKFEFDSKAVDPKYFGSIKAYNDLCLSKTFYSLFKDYKYMLIYQTDVVVFKDDLLKWTKKNYDFVGAPWLNSFWLIWHNIILKDGIINGLHALFGSRIYNAVGNGGFSLRKISSFIEAFELAGTERIKWKSNDDYFWGIVAKNKKGSFILPSGKEALDFSMETSPKLALKNNNGNLPFGLHAWDKFDSSVWETEIEKIKKSLNL